MTAIAIAAMIAKKHLKTIGISRTKTNYRRVKSIMLEMIEKSVLVYGDYTEGYYKYSIIIPTYKRPQSLEETLISAINQHTSQKYEIVVVDNDPFFHNDGLKTETEHVMEKYKADNVLYFRNKENLGMVGNWNQGLSLARGEYVTILHDDDWIEPNFLEEVERRIDGSKMLLFKPVIYDFRKKENNMQNFWKKAKYKIRGTVDNVFRKKEMRISDFFLRNPAYGTLGVILKKDVAYALGGFDETLYPIMDYIFLFRYCEKEGACLYKKKITNYRIAINESFKAAKTTPLKLYEFRNEIFNQYPQCLRGVYKYVKELYVHDIILNEREWGIDIEKPGFYEGVKKSLKYKIFEIRFKLYMLIKV